MNDLKKRACGNCGLIQLEDPLFGRQICGAPEALIYGCPERKDVENFDPDCKYDEEIYINRKCGYPEIFSKLWGVNE